MDGTKKRHWPYNCWTLHPDRIPERYSNNNNSTHKPKANKATTERPDDFVDNDHTHISAMAHIITCDPETVGDDEFWGFPTDETAVSSPSPPLDCLPPLDSLLPPLEDLMPPLDCLPPPLDNPLPSPSLPVEYALAYSAEVGGQLAQTQDWMVDSGCTNPMYFAWEEFINYCLYQASVIIANGATLSAKGRGTVTMEWLLDDGTSNTVSIKDVLHVPDLTCGLYSISQATRKGFEILFTSDECQILKDNQQIGSAPKVNNTYILSVLQPTAKVAVLIQQNMRALATTHMFNEEAIELWHQRMRHLNEADLKQLMHMSNGMMLTQKPRVRPVCEACSKAKLTRKVLRRTQHEVLEKLGKIHMDLGGPFNVPLINEAKFYMLLTDQATLRTWCFTYKHKDKTYKLFHDWKTEAETQSGCKVKIVRFDNGTEFINAEFKDHFKDSGIIFEPTVPYTPEQNGLSKVQNRIVMNGVRAMLFDSQLSQYLWSELLRTKVYQKNRSPTTRLQGMTSHEAWTGEKPFLGHMHIIGCVAWVHIPKEKRKKLDERSKKCYLVGYEGTNIL